VDLPEPAQVPLDVVQVQLARLVDPQPHLGHQLRGRVVPGGRGELAASRELAAPAGEQHPDLGFAGRDTQRGVLAAPRPVHLIDRARHHVSRHLVDLGFVPQFQEQEVGLQRLRPGQPGAPGRAAQHLPEVSVRVGGLHRPQRTAQPRPDLIQADHLAGDRAVGQARGGPRQDQPGQRVGLERGEFLRASRGARLAQIANDRKRHPAPPVSHDPKEQRARR